MGPASPSWPARPSGMPEPRADAATADCRERGRLPAVARPRPPLASIRAGRITQLHGQIPSSTPAAVGSQPWPPDPPCPHLWPPDPGRALPSAHRHLPPSVPTGRGEAGAERRGEGGAVEREREQREEWWVRVSFMYIYLEHLSGQVGFFWARPINRAGHVTASVNTKRPPLFMLGINIGGYFLCPTRRLRNVVVYVKVG